MIMRALIIRKFEDICPREKARERERKSGRFKDKEVLSDLKRDKIYKFQASATATAEIL